MYQFYKNRQSFVEDITKKIILVSFFSGHTVYFCEILQICCQVISTHICQFWLIYLHI